MFMLYWHIEAHESSHTISDTRVYDTHIPILKSAFTRFFDLTVAYSFSAMYITAGVSFFFRILSFASHENLAGLFEKQKLPLDYS